MKSRSQSLLSIIILLVVSLYTSNILAAEHKLVIQVSSKDPLTQKIALNVATNVQKHYGIDNVDIEVVAFGPGLSILTKKNPQSKRVTSLSQSDIKFSACSNTIKKITKKKGKAPKLSEGVNIVSAGAVRIMELQEQGYTVIKP